MLMTSNSQQKTQSSNQTNELLYSRDNGSGGNSRIPTSNTNQQQQSASSNNTSGQLAMGTNTSSNVHLGPPSGAASHHSTQQLLSMIPPQKSAGLENNMHLGNSSSTSASQASSHKGASSGAQLQSHSELLKELEEAKDKLKIMTTKFATARKERDQLKTDNKELQDEVIQLQSSMRQMVPCMSNTSQSFPMFNELSNQCSELYKCDCQDVFFDLLCPELNIEGVVFFYQNIFPPIMVAIQKHFAPAEQVLHQVSCLPYLDGPVESVLRKTYQSNWRQIMKASLTDQFFTSLANQIQETLSINDGDQASTHQIKQFAQKVGELCFKMVISDPPICLDLASIGQKVRYNQYKYDAIDGFIKAEEECFIILPSVHKQAVASGQTAQGQNGGAPGLSSFTMGGHSGSLGEVLIKANVLPLNYEFP